MDSLTRRLARLVRARDVTSDDLRATERYVRDWLGSFVAGSAAPVGRRLIGYGGRSGDLEARVFLAAALSHVTETDDLHNGSVTHPGCVVIPVALLLADARAVRAAEESLGVADEGVSGMSRGHAVLRATLAGYEVMTRVGEALGPAHYRTFHNTATAGVFGAAATAASLLRLDEDGWVWALGSAGTQAAGLWQFNEEGAMSKPLHAGHAASAGLRAALLAAEGFTGAEAILEGEKGLFRALCPDARPEAVLADGRPTDDPGQPVPPREAEAQLPERGNVPARWKLQETSMKPYPCCRHVHAAIDAALEVRGELNGAAPIRALIESYPAALGVTDRPRVRSPHDARFSMQYAVATTLLRGRPGLEAFEPEAIGDEDVQALVARSTVEPSDALAAAYPRRWGARVRVEAADGSEQEAARDSATGDPDRPLDDDALDAKVKGLLAWAGLDAERGQELLDACRALVDDGPVFELPNLPGARAETGSPR